MARLRAVVQHIDRPWDMKHLYFIRHGLSQLGKQSLWAGSTDTPLADEGRVQATQAGQAAQNLGIDYIICSPLVRAHDTARLLAAELDYPPENIEINPLVVERDFGELEATPWRADMDIDAFPVVGLESIDSIIDRAARFYAYLQTLDYDTILVVSHGSFGRALRHVIHPETPFDITGRLQNAEIVKFV